MSIGTHHATNGGVLDTATTSDNSIVSSRRAAWEAIMADQMRAIVRQSLRVTTAGSAGDGGGTAAVEAIVYADIHARFPMLREASRVDQLVRRCIAEEVAAADRTEVPAAAREEHIPMARAVCMMQWAMCVAANNDNPLQTQPAEATTTDPAAKRRRKTGGAAQQRTTAGRLRRLTTVAPLTRAAAAVRLRAMPRIGPIDGRVLNRNQRLWINVSAEVCGHPSVSALLRAAACSHVDVYEFAFAQYRAAALDGPGSVEPVATAPYAPSHITPRFLFALRGGDTVHCLWSRDDQWQRKCLSSQAYVDALAARFVAAQPRRCA